MAHLDDEQLAEFKDAFALFDRVGDGKIDASQIGDVLRSLNQNPSDAEIKKLIKDVDPKGKKRLDFDEFLPIYMDTAQKKEKGTVNEFVEVMRMFDKNNIGMVSTGELRHVLSSLGDKLSDEQIDMLFADAGESGGHINYETLVNVVMSN